MNASPRWISRVFIVAGLTVAAVAWWLLDHSVDPEAIGTAQPGRRDSVGKEPGLILGVSRPSAEVVRPVLLSIVVSAKLTARPIEGAECRIVAVADGRPEVTTNAAGSARLEVPSGFSGRIVIRAAGYRDHEEDVVVPERGGAALHVALQGNGVIHGVVTGLGADDKRGRPLQGARVLITGLGASVTLRTDQDGTFRLAGIPTPRSIRVAAAYTGFAGARKTVRLVGERRVTLTLAPVALCRVRVRVPAMAKVAQPTYLPLSLVYRRSVVLSARVMVSRGQGVVTFQLPDREPGPLVGYLSMTAGAGSLEARATTYMTSGGAQAELDFAGAVVRKVRFTLRGKPIGRDLVYFDAGAEVMTVATDDRGVGRLIGLPSPGGTAAAKRVFWAANAVSHPVETLQEMVASVDLADGGGQVTVSVPPGLTGTLTLREIRRQGAGLHIETLGPRRDQASVSFRVPAGLYRIELSGTPLTEYVLAVRPGEQISRAVAAAGETGSITGSVDSIAEAEVTVWRVTSDGRKGEKRRVLRVAPKGTFEVDGLPPDRYLLTVRFGEGRAASKNLEVRSAQVSSAGVISAANLEQVTITLLRADGQPLGHQRVFVSEGGYYNAYVHRMTTDSRGQVRLDVGDRQPLDLRLRGLAIQLQQGHRSHVVKLPPELHAEGFELSFPPALRQKGSVYWLASVDRGHALVRLRAAQESTMRHVPPCTGLQHFWAETWDGMRVFTATPSEGATSMRVETPTIVRLSAEGLPADVAWTLTMTRLGRLIVGNQRIVCDGRRHGADAPGRLVVPLPKDSSGLLTIVGSSVQYRVDVDERGRSHVERVVRK